MRPVTVTIRPIRDIAIILEARHPPEQVRVHRIGVAGIQPRVRHAHRHSGAVETKLLRHRGCGHVPVIPSDQLRRRFIHQLALGRALHPQHRHRLGQCRQMARPQFPPHNGALPQMALRINHRQMRARAGDLRRRRRSRQQNINIQRLVGQHRQRCGGRQARMNLVFRPVGPDPMNVRHPPDCGR